MGILTVQLVWCFVRLFIPSPSGKKRFNVLAALDAVSKEIITVTNETYINAESVCQLIAEIAKLGLDKPITLILDNARYQKCALVQNYAAALNIELLFPVVSKCRNLSRLEYNWQYLSTFFKYPPEIRRIIYTTNAIENFNRQIRKITKTKSSFPTDDSLFKILYLIVFNASEKWTMPMRDWGIIVNQLRVYSGERVDTYL